MMKQRWRRPWEPRERTLQEHTREVAQRMVSETGSDELRTSLVADAVRYHVRLILVCALAGLALAFAVSQTTTKSYTATAIVLINPLVGNPYSPDGAGDSLINLETEAQLVRSDVLAGQVSQATSIPPRQLQTNLVVTVPVNTQILEIAYSASTADNAVTVVNDYAKSYLSIRAQNRDSVVQEQISGLETQITKTQASLLKALDNASKGNYASRVAQTLTGQLASLRIQAAQITTSGKKAGQVISPGLAPASPNGFPLPLLLAAGLLLGLVASLVLAVSRERSAHLVRHPQQVEGAGVPVLAMVRGSRGEDRAAVYRRLRASLGRVPPGVLTVVGCASDADGASGVVATELAVSTTRSGLRVLLVDTVGAASHTVAPSVAAAGYGLSDLLVDDVDVEDALIAVPTDAERQLLLVTPGREPGVGVELFGTDAMVGVLNELKAHCDQMFVASAGLSEPDGPALTAQAESVLLVVTLGQTSYSDVTSAMEWLRRSNTPLVGAVIVEKRKLKVAKDLGVGAAVQGGSDGGAQRATDTDRVSTPVSRGATVARNA